jgi:hypothetical protein
MSQNGTGRMAACALTALTLVWGGGCREEEKPDKVVVAANVAARDGATKATMRAIYRAEMAYRISHNRFGGIDELVASGELAQNPNDGRTSSFTVTASEERFECQSAPASYRTTGGMSFFIDETGVLRGEDNGGRPASANSPSADN